MSVAIRVIPCLDVDAGRVVKGINFEGLRDAGDPVELAHRYDRAGADELTFLDVTASSGNRDNVFDVVSRTAEEVFIPLTVGGEYAASRTLTSCCAPARTRPPSTRPPWPAPTSSTKSPGTSVRRCWCCPWTHGGRTTAPRRRALKSPRTAAAGDRDRRRRLGPRGGGPRRGGDPAELHRRRRHPRGLRH